MKSTRTVRVFYALLPKASLSKVSSGYCGRKKAQYGSSCRGNTLRLIQIGLEGIGSIHYNTLPSNATLYCDSEHDEKGKNDLLSNSGLKGS